MSRWLRVRLVLDRVVAAALLVVAAVPLAVSAVLVHRDGGPAFVRVSRIGRHGHPFGMWKVRTMRADGAGGVATGSSLAAGEVDPRITPIGRRLRRWRVDELANLLNVVRGEMALLGPRPEAPDFVDAGDPRWAAVLAAPPAIAGPTQVLVEAWEGERLAEGGEAAYRDEVLPVKLAVDAWYVRSASPAIDLAVVRGLLGWTRTRGSGSSSLRTRVAKAVPEVSRLP